MIDHKTVSKRRLNSKHALAGQGDSERSRMADASPEGLVRAVRKSLAITQRQLGSRVGISRQSVQDMERAEVERRITLGSLDRLAGAMGFRVVLSLVPEKESGRNLRVPVHRPGVAPLLNSPVASYASKPAKPRIPLGKLAELCRKYHVRKLSLFGSAARNELKPGSDVDLLVEFEPEAGVTLLDLPALQEELSPLFEHRRIDLVTREVLENPYRRQTILPDMKTLYAA